ncbi:PEP-CTERM sorting domain-containing protein [Pontiella agarivorans]|uniref:PEP-CTERM sorting domain-containing protein n=1 Tax=Pontiella agarivorans TaxID=3038953 RepID=A0ABU5MSH5_9BACT|nr:PEP-CTERM sorting domain-containing protein [Pontiella agarivorans]MDZ8117082.1 PEP-CTERM sorting domain-containing protein [Pontiella agarivorans]
MNKWIIGAALFAIGVGAQAAVITSSADGVLDAAATWDGVNSPTNANSDTWNSAGYDHSWQKNKTYYGTYVVQSGTTVTGSGNFDHVQFENMTLAGGTLQGARGQEYTVDANLAVISDSLVTVRRSGIIKGDGTATLTGNGNLTILQDTDANDSGDEFALGMGMDMTGYTGNILFTTDGGGSGADTFDLQILGDTSAAGTFGLALENQATGDVSVRLDLGTSNDFTVQALSFGGTTVANGTYTAADLTTAGFGDWVAGSGSTVTVIPEPATLGMVVAMGVGVLFIRRRFMM